MCMSMKFERGRNGDQHAFDLLVSPYLTEVQVHCYRMLGSLQDAEDVVQETTLAAWTGLADFENRCSVRTWLYRIATNRWLNHQRSAKRRPQPAPPSGVPAPTALGEVSWLQPFPDSILDRPPDRHPRPAARYESREAITLAFVTAMQHLSPRQRATLIFRAVLGYPAKDTAEILNISVVAANNSLKRARATLRRSGPHPSDELAKPSKEDEALLKRFVDAFMAFDVDAMVDLMSDYVWLKMPPAPFEYHGREAAREFLSAVAAQRQPTALLVPMANAHLAWGIYRSDPATGLLHLSGSEVAAIKGGFITELTRFETEAAHPFGLPRTLQS
jgi:RNA polymerase sigma-70 factor (TIGR02960 family)